MALLEGRRLFLIPTDMLLQVVGVVAAECAAACVLAAIPCWVVLTRLHLAGPAAAAMLGVALSELCGHTMANQGSSLVEFSVVGIAGGLAGLATWTATRALPLKVR